MFKILCIGEIYIDLIQKIEQGNCIKYTEHINGSPAMVAVQSSVLGAESYFIGNMSNDLFGQRIQNQLKAYKVNTDMLIKNVGYKIPINFIIEDKNENKHRITYNQDSFYLEIDINEKIKELIDKCNIVHFGSLMLNNENSKNQLIDILSYCKSKNKTITYDPNYRDFFWTSKSDAINNMVDVLKYVDIIKVSEDELKMLTDCDKFIQGIAELLKTGIRAVIVTQGKSGCIVSCRSGIQTLQTYKVNTVDKKGAGDSFFGGFLYKLAESEKHIIDISMEELVSFCDFANACASLSSTKTGTFISMPSKEQVINCMLTCDKI